MEKPNEISDPQELENLRLKVKDALRKAYARLVEFAATEPFQLLLDELYQLPPEERPSFVNRVVLVPREMEKRNIVPPEGILIQRSSFGDRRPTLFCIKQYLPEHLSYWWRNANITFDNFVGSDQIPTDERAWRPPLDFDVQQALTAGKIDEDLLSKS